MTYEIGDRVRADEDVLVGQQTVAAYINEFGVITAKGLAARVEVQVQWDRTHILTVVGINKITVVEGLPEEAPEPESPPVMGWFASLAESNILEVPSQALTSDRNLAVAQVYANLEIAAALDRLALAVDQAVRR